MNTCGSHAQATLLVGKGKRCLRNSHSRLRNTYRRLTVQLMAFTGVPPSIMDRILDQFYGTDRTGGTGLGLSICKEAATQYGG